jgi:ornithine--oxo-acid transaminase
LPQAGTLFIAGEVQTGIRRTGGSGGRALERRTRRSSCQNLSGGHVPSDVLTRRKIFDKVFDRMDRAATGSNLRTTWRWRLE